MRYRKQIGAENILILTDVKKKHSSHSITSDVSIEETANAAEFFLSDGIIVSGSSTGKEPDINDVKKVKEVVNIPVILGSGITIDNVENYYPITDAFIIGSHFKKDSSWKNEVDDKRVKTFMKKYNQLSK